MHTDDEFLQKLLDNPADDTARLVYADWLDEQDDPTAKLKSQFLRLTVQLAGLGKKQRQKRKLLGKQLQERAAMLDIAWLAVVSRMPVENCAGKRGDDWQARYPALFDFVCDKRWDQMTPTANRDVRFCEACRESVHYCDTIMAGREHAEQRHCVAIDLGVIRRDGDLRPPLLVLGMVGPDFYRREEERLKPDPVSEERARRKRQASDEPTGGA